jgi:hypothetical protein
MKAAGHDAVHVSKIGLTSTEDRVIMERALNEGPAAGGLRRSRLIPRPATRTTLKSAHDTGDWLRRPDQLPLA